MSLVSIIMPYFKKDFFIEKSINSILKQSYENFEIIIINDEINKNSSELLKKVSKIDTRIKVFENKKNSGAGESRNKGIQYSKGEYIAFCDCDDLWKPSKLEKQIKFMKNSNLKFSFTAYDVIDENENKIGYRQADDFINFEKLEKSCDIGLSTVLLKKNIFDDTSFRFPNLVTKEDYVLWIMMAKSNIEMRGINQNLSSWRKTKNSLSSSILQKLFDGYRVYRKYLRYSRIKSFLCLMNLSINFILKK